MTDLTPAEYMALAYVGVLIVYGAVGVAEEVVRLVTRDGPLPAHRGWWEERWQRICDVEHSQSRIRGTRHKGKHHD